MEQSASHHIQYGPDTITRYMRKNMARVGEHPYLGVRENRSLGIGLIGKDWGRVRNAEDGDRR